MFTIEERTTLVGISELRTKLDEVLKAAKHSKVVIGRRNKPVAVLMDIDVYNRLDGLIEAWSDEQLSVQASQRLAAAKRRQHVHLAQAKKQLGL